ncbi:sporulation protein YunB [Cohnella lubricantis]|uniref:Sporulation protein YunB n=1 Tax=Cohnella lubricantis TaxID=2163172 RepID=A0A841TH86_9BACL|nr:sporulation protein YunB [Cohnella lubricantis]MBB6679766.1 sporulation protein YunB [Cohnella lubricantis]MBP2118448.1 sporulation protein YunB [Cohnella lubricantis]
MRRRWGKPPAIRWKWNPPAKSRGFRAARRWSPRLQAPAARSGGFVARKRRRPLRPAAYSPQPQGWVVRPRRRMKRRHFWLIMLLIFVLATIQSVYFLDKYLRDPLMFLAKVRITQIATEAVNQAIMDNVASDADSSRMIQWQTNEAGKVTGFLIDYKEQMQVTAETIEVVKRTLEEQSELYERIPIGHALNSPFISSIGPSVAVRFHPASAVQVEVRTRQTNLGINNVQIEVYAHIKTSIAVLIPFDQEPTTLETEIPLSYLMVVGDVPTYYYDGRGNPVGSGAAQAPTLALPNQAPTIADPSAASSGNAAH